MFFRAHYLGEHRTNPRTVSTRAEIDEIIDELLQQDFDHRLASIGQPDEAVSGYRSTLMIGVVPKQQLGLLSYWGNEGRYFSVGPSDSQEQLTLYMCGSEYYFPASSLMALSQVRAGAAEFLETGGAFPRNVQWRSDG